MALEKRLQDLTYWDALEIFFPDLSESDREALPMTLVPPPKWSLWQAPKGRSKEQHDLDKEITRLAKNKDEAMKARGIPCPYFVARMWIVLAVRYAGDTEVKEAARRKNKMLLERQSKWMNDNADELHGFFFDADNPERFWIEDAAPIDERGTARPDQEKLNAVLNIANASLEKIDDAIQALRVLAKLVDSELRDYLRYEATPMCGRKPLLNRLASAGGISLSAIRLWCQAVHLSDLQTPPRLPSAVKAFFPTARSPMRSGRSKKGRLGTDLIVTRCVIGRESMEEPLDLAKPSKTKSRKTRRRHRTFQIS
jgi:hypothetical protein